MLEPGTAVIHRVTGERMVVLPPRCESNNNGKVCLEGSNTSWGWSADDEEKLSAQGRVEIEVDEKCKPCTFHSPSFVPSQKASCVRHLPERWSRVPLGGACRPSLKGKELPFKLYPECKNPQARVKIP